MHQATERPFLLVYLNKNISRNKIVIKIYICLEYN